MFHPYALLLNFSPASRIGDELCRVMASHPGFRLRLKCRTVAASDGVEAGEKWTAELSSGDPPDVIVAVFETPLISRAQSLLTALSRASVNAPLVVIAEGVAPEEMITLLDLGVTDFIVPPFTPLAILPRLWRLISRRQSSRTVEQATKEQPGLKQTIGESPALLAVTRKIPVIARCDAAILISGETGTGKEMCARAIHYLSPRSDHSFVPINCGAIPSELVENEMFGHERGAFTDAKNTRTGLVEEANGGTLFLDEIDSLAPAAQVKLLRFLQEKEYRPLGSAKTRKADVRIIAASNADFNAAVATGALRQDLYYRLNVIRLHLPPLRDRREDIPQLAHHFLKKYSASFRKQITGFSGEAMRALTFAAWPGNVRELEHIVERAVALAERPVIQVADLDLTQATPEQPLTFRQAKLKFVAQFEQAYIQELLRQHKGNISQAARAAEKDRRSFWELMRKHEIDPNAFRTATSAK